MTETRSAVDRGVAAIIKQHALFAAVDDTILDDVVAQCRAESAEAGAELFRQGDRGTFAYILLDGEVDVFVDSPLGSSHVAVIGPPHFIGEIGAFSDLPRTATVRARGPVALLRLDQAALRPLIARHPDLAFSVIGELGRRLNAINQPLSYLMHAVTALERGEFDPAMLSVLTEQAGEVTPFAKAFERMAHELTTKQDRRREMEIAARIQRSILPASVPDWPGIALNAAMLPAREVGGDFYDYFPTGDGRFAVLVADVSGKGVPAALFMAVARTALRAVAAAGALAVEDVARRANALIAADNDQCMFVTLFLGLLDAQTGWLDYVNLGHTITYHLPAAGGLVPLESMGLALGMVEDWDYQPRRLRLAPGDALFLYTDGVTEAFAADGAIYGDDKLERLLTQIAHLAPAGMNARVVAEVEAFAAGAEQSDDITCLALRWSGGAEG